MFVLTFEMTSVELLVVAVKEFVGSGSCGYTGNSAQYPIDALSFPSTDASALL